MCLSSELQVEDVVQGCFSTLSSFHTSTCILVNTPSTYHKSTLGLTHDGGHIMLTGGPLCYWDDIQAIPENP